MEPFDLLGRAAHRHHRAGGERRHRQDLRPRRPGHPLRRRGRRDARRDAADHLRPRRQPGAARAGPRPADRRPSGPLADPEPVARGHRPARSPRPRLDANTRQPMPGCATPWPTSTPPPSPPPTSSASWCCARSASRATPTPASPWSTTWASWSPRSSTTSTSCASAAPRRHRRSPAPPRSRSPPRWSATRTPAWSRRSTPRDRPRASGSTSRWPCSPRWSVASAGSASSATTTC